MKKRVLSGIRSTGQLHLGNYFGALRNFVKLQDEAECFFFIADYHSLTTHPDPAILHGNVRNILSEYLAAGIDPEKATIYVQSDVPEVAELSLLLGMHAYVGELERTASFKDKVRKNPNNVNIGLLNYPVLMASDILLHRADYVPVGKDQEQHLEMTRHLAHRFNQIYKTDFFNENVAPFNFGKDLVKIPGLDGSGKMGKSEGNGIYLSDPDNVIRKKVMKAVTDSGPTEPNSPISEPIKNIFTIMEAVSTPDTIEYFNNAIIVNVNRSFAAIGVDHHVNLALIHRYRNLANRFGVKSHLAQRSLYLNRCFACRRKVLAVNIIFKSYEISHGARYLPKDRFHIKRRKQRTYAPWRQAPRYWLFRQEQPPRGAAFYRVQTRYNPYPSSARCAPPADCKVL